MEQLGDLTDDDTATAGAPDPAAPAPRADRVIGGVAGTIAERLGVDALWVRLGFVVLGLVGGIGVIVYAAWWLILAGGRHERAMRIAGGALLVGAVPLLIAGGSLSFINGPLAVILLLGGLALALWQPRREPRQPATTPIGFPPPAPPFPQPAPDAAPLEEYDGPWHVVADGMRPPAASPGRGWRRPRPPRRTPSMLGRITLFVALYVGAAWALADQLDGGRLHPEQWFGAAAVVCGAGMVVGVFLGRARWLIVPAVIAAGVGYAGGTMARLGITSSDLADDRYVSVGSYTATGDISERVGLGELRITVDSVPPAPVHIDARVGLGRIHLHVPADVTVELRPRLDHGSIRSNQGLAISETAPTLIGEGPTADVVVDAWVGLGDIDVTVFDAPLPFPGELAPVPPDAGSLVPADAGSLVAIRDGISMTTDGWVVLGDGEAVIGPDGQITSPYAGLPQDDGTQTIDTAWGSFRLLPRSLLLTPNGEVLDLQALRAEVAAAAPTTTTPTPTTTATPPTVAPTTVPGG
jgi:phage shock protein PspC (stress-responsive transcriptional regulator)